MFKQDTNLEGIIISKRSSDIMERKRINIQVSLENYSYLKGLGHTADSFNQVLTSVLAEHKNRRENNVSESGSGLRALDQIPTSSPNGDEKIVK
jgi:hypothetical protein